jgi:hypothetical protein
MLLGLLVRFWVRWCGPLLRQAPGGGKFMILHYCRQSKCYCWCHLRDFLSLNEHFTCSECDETRFTRHVFCLSFFFFHECARVAKEKGRSQLYAFWLSIVGIARKDLPLHRDGKTADELEMGAFHLRMLILAEYRWSLDALKRSLP